MTRVPERRIRVLRNAPPRPDGDFVLYWMTAFRRITWNFSLDRAVHWSRELQKPLVIFEPLRCDYKWACDRLHGFILDGMEEKAGRLQKSGVFYYPYVEADVGRGKGLLAELSKTACIIVTDDFPCFFIPRMLSTAAKRVQVRMEAVDSNGLLPLRVADQVFKTAYSFRRFLQKNLPEYLSEKPAADPLNAPGFPRQKPLPDRILERWPPETEKTLAGRQALLSSLPLDHTVGATGLRGGTQEALKKWNGFLKKSGLHNYEEDHNRVEKTGTSGLSPYLHFGQVSVHRLFDDIRKFEGWSPERLSRRTSGQRQGWWGVHVSSEAFLDQLITWRELGFNMCWQREDYDRFESLPEWALKTLASHAGDPRANVYPPEALETAATHDPLWNAAQTQLVREGTIHNYLRMLWGKKILEWSPSPQDALEVMLELNNKYALDGRDPNSYSGIFWVLGRYDRAWGPERDVFGKVRYMSSENTARKMRVADYIARHTS